MPGLFDVAHAAEHLQRRRAHVDRALGEPALDDRDHQLDERLVLLAHRRVFGLVRVVERRRGDVRQRAHRLDVRLAPQQHAPHVGVLDDRDRLGIARRDVAELDAFLRVLDRVLVRAVGDREALHADGEARGVHHHEHVLQAAVRLADEVADRAFAVLAVVERARRVRVDAELVLDPRALHVVALAQRAVGVHQHLGHDEHRDALGAFGRARQPREHEVDDVRRHVVLAERDEDLLALDAVVVALGRRRRAHLREVRARLRLGEAHRARPLTAHELRDVRLLVLVGRELLDRFDRALIEQRAVREAHVRRVPHLERRPEHELRQTLAAVLRLHRQTDPARFGELVVRLFETLGRRDDAVVPRAAFLIAALVERREHFRRERRRFFEDRVEHVGGVFVAGKLRDLLDAGELAQDELHVAQRRAVGAHEVSPYRSRRSTCSAAMRLVR